MMFNSKVCTTPILYMYVFPLFPDTDHDDGLQPARDEDIVVENTQHIISAIRVSYRLDEKDTTTGLDQRTLVLKPGVLHKGLQYMIQVNVKHKRKLHFTPPI